MEQLTDPCPFSRWNWPVGYADHLVRSPNQAVHGTCEWQRHAIASNCYMRILADRLRLYDWSWNLIPNHLRFGSLGFNMFQHFEGEDRVEHVELPFTSIGAMRFRSLLALANASRFRGIAWKFPVAAEWRSWEIGWHRAGRKHPMSYHVLPVLCGSSKTSLQIERLDDSWSSSSHAVSISDQLWADSEARYNFPSFAASRPVSQPPLGWRETHTPLSRDGSALVAGGAKAAKKQSQWLLKPFGDDFESSQI